eukprot:75893_1
MAVWAIVTKLTKRCRINKKILNVKNIRSLSSTDNFYTHCCFLNHYRDIVFQNDYRWFQHKAWMDAKPSRWIDVVAIESYICAADGEFSELEKKAMYETKILYGIDSTLIDEGIQKAEKLINSNNPNILDDFVKNEWKDLESPYVPNVPNLIASCIYFAGVDGLHYKELEKAKEVAIKLGMDEHAFNKLVMALEKEEQLFHDFNEIFALEPPK